MVGLALIAQIAVVANAPAAAVTCAPFDVSVAARVTGAVAPRFTLPPAPGVQVLNARVSSRVDHFAGGDASTLAEGSFTIAVSGAGRVVLPRVLATLGTARGASEPMAVELRPPDDAQPRVLVRARLEPERDSVVVGQQLDYVVDVQLNAIARERLRRNPTFFPPEMPGVLAYDQALPPPARRGGAHCFEALTYRRALFPLFAGAVTIPPATLNYSLPVSTSFFSREESFELTTDSVRFVATEPPAAGRPAAWIGAVGDVHASSRLASSGARMGDPVLLTLHLEAVGNVKLMPRPVIDLPWASVSLGDERVTVDSTVPQVRGTKEFDWLLTPRRAGHQVVPPISYPFFDPSRAAYDVAVTDSLPLDVTAATLAATDTAPVARLSVRTVLRDPQRAPLPSRPWFWALLAVAPAPAAVRRLRVRGRRRARPQTAIRRLRALTRSPDVDLSTLRRAFRDALADRVPTLSAGTSLPALARALRRAGVTDATAERASSLLAELDAAAFGTSHQPTPDLVTRAVAIARAVDEEAVRPSNSRPAAMVLIVAAALVGVSARAAAPAPLRRAFADGVSAYQRGDFNSAERLFARVSAREPRAGDAWANLGTAAWARGDSALAAAGWQRALRLDPLDIDARDRFASVQSTAAGDPAWVPPLPVDVVAIIGLAAWLGGWMLMAFRPRRSASVAGPFGRGATVLAVVLLLVTLELEHRASPRGLAAVRASRTLLSIPAADGQPVASVAAGEVGEMGARQGMWVHVTIDRERAGWLPAVALLPLDAPLE